jgi:hypothetical protein
MGAHPVPAHGGDGDLRLSRICPTQKEANRARASSPHMILGSGSVLLKVGIPTAWTSTYRLSSSRLVCTSPNALATLAGVGVLPASIPRRPS